MADYNGVKTSIENYIATNWADTRIAYENVEALDYGDAANPVLSAGTTPYIETKVIYTDAPAVETGVNAIKQCWGYLQVFFYSKQETGTKSNQDNAQILIDLFEYKNIGDAVFKDVTFLSSYEQASWYVTPIMIRFYFLR